MVAIAVRRKTGATASWIVWEMSWSCVSTAMRGAYRNSTSNPSRRAASIRSSEVWTFAGSAMVVSLSRGMTARTVAAQPPG